MAAPPVTDEAFFALVRQSGLVGSQRLDGYLSLRGQAGVEPGDARAAAMAVVGDGLVTKYQAEQLLAGRWRNFVVAEKYLILDRVGHGGSSAIFLAVHRTIHRPVALKILPANQADNRETLARFYREARAAAMLDHPNIADLYDIHQIDKTHFLVMEFIFGPDLEGLVQTVGPLPTARAAAYIRQAAAGLQHAHEAGLVHRDIKPSNLLVDRTGIVKLLDLGLVRIFQSDDGLTKGENFRYVLGTLDYQAPEQAVDSHEVDIRADIYSLGASLYFLLTGQPLFPEGTIAEKLTWHQRRQPRPISDYRDDVPAGLASVVDRMIAKSAADRYQEPAEVVEALAGWAGGTEWPPAEPELPWLSKASRKFLDSRPRPTQPAVDLRDRRTPLPALAAPAAVEGPSTIVVPAPIGEPTAIVAVPARVGPGRARAGPWLRRGALVAAASVAAIAFAGTRNSPPAPGSPPTAPSTAATPPAPPNLFASAMDLNKPIDAETDPVERSKLLVKRGNLYSRLARWRQAADDFRRALELDPSDDWTWYFSIPTLAEIGDREGYRARCREMMGRFESSDDVLLGERIAKLWLLTPDCPDDPAIPARLIERASKDAAKRKLYYWVLSTRGIASYRAGRFAEATSDLSRAIETAPATTLQCKALSGLFLSMALRRQDLRDQARQAFDRAAAILDRHQQQNNGDLGAEWCDWLMCEIARREAEEVLGSAR